MARPRSFPSLVVSIPALADTPSSIIGSTKVKKLLSMVVMLPITFNSPVTIKLPPILAFLYTLIPPSTISAPVPIESDSTVLVISVDPVFVILILLTP